MMIDAVQKTIIPEQFPLWIEGFGYAVGDQDETVAGLHLAVIAFVGSLFEKADGEIAVSGPQDFVVAYPHRWDMTTVDVFEIAIRTQADDDHGRVFFTDVLVREEAVHGVHDFGQWHA